MNKKLTIIKKNISSHKHLFTVFAILFASILYITPHILFAIESPFFYQEELTNTTDSQFKHLDPNKSYSTEYQAQFNNLGIINVFFKSNSLNDEEFIPSDSVQKFPVNFSISQKGQPPFYSNDHVIIWARDAQFSYPFGFPVVENSKNQQYIITLTTPIEAPPSSLLVATHNEKSELLVSGKYVIPWPQWKKIYDTYDIASYKMVNILNQKIAVFFALSTLMTLLILVYPKNIYTSVFTFSLIVLGLFQFQHWLTGSKFNESGYSLTIYYFVITACLSFIALLIKNRQLIHSEFARQEPPWLHKKANIILIITTLSILAFGIRLHNLGALDPYTDEYPHLLSAKEIVENQQILDEPYTRSYYTVTLPVAISLQLFGTDFASARLPGVVFNVLATIPLYLIAKRINKTVALIALFLYATSPWIIAVSRSVREYAYYPFYFYWIVYAMIRFHESIPDKLKNIQDYLRTLFSWQTLIWLALLILPIVYSTKIDTLSTFRVILLAYIPFSMLLLTKVDFRSRFSQRFLIVGGLILVGIFFNYIQNTKFIDIKPNYSSYWINLFGGNPLQQWYYNLIPLFQIVLPVTTLILGIAFYKSNKWIIFNFSLFAVFLYFFIFHFDRYFQPRYAISIEFWYLITIAIGLYFFIKLLKVLKLPLHTFGFISIILLININHVINLLSYTDYGFAPITNVYHDKVEPAAQYIISNSNKNDVVIGGNVMNYLRYADDNLFRKYKIFYHFNKDTYPDLISYIKEHPTGWVVIDTHNYNRYGYTFSKDLISNFPDNEYYFQETVISGQVILYWKKNNTH